MAPVATREHALADRAHAAENRVRLFEPGGLTLEDVVLRAWDALVANGHAECPVCGGSMSPASGCSDCGSDLS
jgi:hypothetical protein